MDARALHAIISGDDMTFSHVDNSIISYLLYRLLLTLAAPRQCRR